MPFGLKAKSKISERTAQTGLEFGDSKAKGGLFFIYDRKKNQPGLKAEMSALNMIGLALQQNIIMKKI